MKNKILHGLICIVLVISILPSITAVNLDDRTNEKTILVGPDDILDQEQLQHSHESTIHSCVWMAQSFKPSMTPLTKILLEIDKPVVIKQPLELSIRKNLTGPELTYISLPSSQIPYYTHWVEFDFQDVEVIPEETYYIVVRSSTPPGMSYQWLDDYNTTGDTYNRGKQWQSNTYGRTWTCGDSKDFYIDFTFQTYSYISNPDLECEGLFNWTNVKPGDTVTGSFTVKNIGSPFSHLNWKIIQWPSWGVWTFTPPSGDGLRPEDGIVNVQVSVVAPHSDIPDKYTGQIKIVNNEDESDYCILQASLVTPVNRGLNLQLYQPSKRIIPVFPLLERILVYNQFIKILDFKYGN